MADKSDSSTTPKRQRGRPAKYANNKERKAARAQAARERRARQKAAGFREVRRLVKPKSAPLESDIIDLSHIPDHRKR
ncbi:hypothetical protein B9G39_27075 [Zooshikella ganghwensis]|uniref:Uncharacterized protein n=1 Tax=Zooshikella ganghwensis TaxID=202772 RepID=A0A4P9VF71_9GAMM|nr:hypothetical protein B9G39_27075 [Zooshikella ganghwensis]